MRKIWIKRLLSLLIAALLALGAVSCRQRMRAEKRESTVAKEEQELLIFVEAGIDLSLMKNFKAAYPDVAYRQVSYQSIEIAVKQNGDPDIILSGCNASLQEFYKEGYILDMTTLYDLDTTYDAQAYYPRAESVGKINERIYALPLGLETNYMTVADSDWQQMTFKMLPEEYSVQQLLDAMIEELLKEDRGERAVFSGGYKESFYDWLWDSGAIEVAPNEVYVNQMLFEQIAEMLELKTQNYWQQNNKNPQILEWNHALNPLANKEMYRIICWGGASDFDFKLNAPHVAPQSALVYAQSAQKSLLGENIHVLWRPSENRNGQYAAKVNVCGMIGKHTKQEEKAYDVLRKMMDMPWAIWQLPDRMNDSSFPINCQQSLAMLETVEQEGTASFYVVTETGIETIEKQVLSDELRQELNNYLTHIAYVYRTDRRTQEKVQEIWEAYMRKDNIYNLQMLYEAIYGFLQKELI